MKRKVALFVALWSVIGSSTTWAEDNFVQKFLNRYKPSPIAVSSQNPAQALNDLVREGAVPLTVGDVVQLLLDHNLDVTVNRYGPQSLFYQSQALRRPFEPTIRIGASVGRDTSPSRSQLTGAPSISQLTHTYQLGFGQTLPTGTSLGVDYSLTRTSSNSAFNTFNPAFVSLLRYTASQHILRDYGRPVNTRQIRISQNNQKISETQFEVQMVGLLVQAQKAYWDLVFSAEDIKVKQRSLELAQKTLADNRKQVEIGTLAPIDVVQAESEAATRQEQLVVTTYSQTQVEDQLKKLVSREGDPGIVLARLAPMERVRRPAPGDVPSVIEAIRVALENRPEMRQLDLELQNRDIDIQYAKNQLLPLLDLNFSYTQNGLGGNETLRAGFGPGAPIVAQNPGGLGDAMRQLFGYNFTGYSVGFNLQIPLSNKAAQAEHARALNERRVVTSRVAATAQQIALDVRNALTGLEMNRARIETAEKARELAERRLDAEQKKFDLGASTIRFVLEEQRNVAQAQTNEIQALINYTKAIVDIDRAMGLTLKKNNVEIEKSLRVAN